MALLMIIVVIDCTYFMFLESTFNPRNVHSDVMPPLCSSFNPISSSEQFPRKRPDTPLFVERFLLYLIRQF